MERLASVVMIHNEITALFTNKVTGIRLEGKAIMNRFVIATLLTTLSSTVATAQPVDELVSRLDGLYFPSSASASSWSCNADQIGMDSGALGIGGGYLDGVENRCELVNPQQISNGTGVRFTAVCSAEGETYSDSVTITKTDAGVTIARNGQSVDWTECPTPPSAIAEPVVTQDRWVFADGVASILSDGDYLEFGCVPAGAATTIPVARMSGCPLCWQGDEIDYSFRVDGGAAEVFTFIKQSNDAGMTSDLYGNPAWRDGIVPLLMIGRQLDVYEGNAVVASYPLNGSSAALDALLDKCN